ncbi:MAG TPA: carboxypeptidase-like regulatory domain-containing protein [Pirellulales bacterium]|nr:carboxypeptidase-like regulatory domain-containing protein [Pirellulales bacterium]
MLSTTLFLLVGLAAGETAVTLSGTVVGPDGQPLAPVFVETVKQPGAMVVVAEGLPVPRFMERFVSAVVPRAPQVLASGAAEDTGKFAVAMPDEMPEIGWRRSRLTAWAYHADFALAVRSIERDWARAGLPMPLKLARADPARLTITDATGQPLSGARVRPQRVAGRPVPEVIAGLLTAVTDAEGFVIVGGPAASDLDAVIVESETGGRQWVVLPRLEVGRPTTIALAPVGRLTGRLIADDAHAGRRRRVRFATWLEAGDETAGGGLAEAVTDDGGHFEVSAIAAGSLTFEIERGETEKGTTEEATGPMYLTDQTAGPQIDPGEATALEIPLRRAVRVTQEVRDRDDGSPIAGVRVSLNWWANNAAIGTTDESGRFFTYMLPGPATPVPMRAPPAYYYPQRALDSQTVGEDSDTIVLNPMRLARGETVCGRVVDREQHPVAGAEIIGHWQMPAGGDVPIHAWSNDRGEFVVQGVASGAQTQIWAVKGELLVTEAVAARPGGDSITLVLEPDQTVPLEVRVVDAAGRPMRGAVVRVWAEERDKASERGRDRGSVIFDASDRLRTDDEGRFRTPRGLPPKLWYALEIVAGGMSPAMTEPLHLATAQTTRFPDVVMHALPRLRAVDGRVVDREGRPIADAVVWQSGDGPRRTKTTSDRDGRFRLSGVYSGAAFLFARKDGYRPGGAIHGAKAERCEIVLRRADEPVRPMSTLPPSVSLEEQRKLAMSLVEPLLPMMRDPVFGRDHFTLLRIIARADPERALDIAENVLTDPDIKDMARHSAALAAAYTDLDEAFGIAESIPRPYVRAQVYLDAWNALTREPGDRKLALLDQALVHARAEPDAGHKIYLLGQIAHRWLDEGQRERARSLLREGQTVAEGLPAPSETTQRDEATHLRGRFAGTLARIDGPAAERLIEGFGEPYRDWYRANLARGLADHDPAAAERVYKLIESPALRFIYGLATLHRLAAVDTERAARLARNYAEAGERAYALGFVAHGLAATDRRSAERLLAEAFDLLERSQQRGESEKTDYPAAVTGAALLPVAERIDPTLVEGYFWRALALRGPGLARRNPATTGSDELQKLAAFVARYDHAAARELLEGLAERIRDVAGQAAANEAAAMPSFMALAIADARRAHNLVRSLPDAPEPAPQNPKLAAARALADWLARGPGDLRSSVYDLSGLRDPEGSDEVP